MVLRVKKRGIVMYCAFILLLFPYLQGSIGLLPGKFYPMMKFIHWKKEEYTICEYTYGKRLLLEQHPVLKKYLDREMQIKESVFQQLFKHQNSASAAERMEELKQEIILTQEALKYYE